jgi:glycosyltransferase involved in cell wall biosynthesis
MRLLVVTQVVDTEHPILGFFHTWLIALAQRIERIEVICLQEGRHDLPANVRVASLGKREGATGILNRLRYSLRFSRQLLRLRREYDVVLVHMNQEYILLAGWYWLLARKPVYLWRNHYQGSFLTDIAAWFCVKVFCTSRHSYTAKYAKTVIMPVGTDAKADKPGSVARVLRSILSLGRIAPSKNIHVILKALGMLRARGVDFTASIRGKVEAGDEAYRDSLVQRADELGIAHQVAFGDPVPKSETHLQYRSHEIFVNASPSGMYDKTIFSAATYGCIVVASSRDFAAEADARCVFKEGDAADLAEKLAVLLALSSAEKTALSEHMQTLAREHTLPRLAERLAEEIQ